jgi:hypothetical protein
MVHKSDLAKDDHPTSRRATTQLSEIRKKLSKVDPGNGTAELISRKKQTLAASDQAASVIG